MFIDWCFTVVSDRLVTVNNSKDIEVRLVYTGQVVHTISASFSHINCITPVPGHSELLVTGHDNGAIYLWDIGKGARAYECMHANAGVHVRQTVHSVCRQNRNLSIVASSTRFMCSDVDSKTVVIANFGDEK